MDSLKYLRNEIKIYFPESSELQLSAHFATHRRFNFYFDTGRSDCFLIYLNWEGDGDIYTLKCLEFDDKEVLKTLISNYPETGSKVFNLGKPRSTFSFDYFADNRLSVLSFKGSANISMDSNEVTGHQLMQCVDPYFL